MFGLHLPHYLGHVGLDIVRVLYAPPDFKFRVVFAQFAEHASNGNIEERGETRECRERAREISKRGGGGGRERGRGG
jgi:hypothetical protein